MPVAVGPTLLDAQRSFQRNEKGIRGIRFPKRQTEIAELNKPAVLLQLHFILAMAGFAGGVLSDFR